MREQFFILARRARGKSTGSSSGLSMLNSSSGMESSMRLLTAFPSRSVRAGRATGSATSGFADGVTSGIAMGQSPFQCAWMRQSKDQLFGKSCNRARNFEQVKRVALSKDTVS
jgi:hypothetical protein